MNRKDDPDFPPGPYTPTTFFYLMDSVESGESCMQDGGFPVPFTDAAALCWTLIASDGSVETTGQTIALDGFAKVGFLKEKAGLVIFWSKGWTRITPPPESYPYPHVDLSQFNDRRRANTFLLLAAAVLIIAAAIVICRARPL